MAVGVVYLVASLGAVGENLVRLKQISDFVNCRSIPWALHGNFNMHPGFLCESGYLGLTRSRAVVP
eukprot:5430055-Pyramimonas_sp.AAC.1